MKMQLENHFFQAEVCVRLAPAPKSKNIFKFFAVPVCIMLCHVVPYSIRPLSLSILHHFFQLHWFWEIVIVKDITKNVLALKHDELCALIN